ncbi:hypothetical protein FA13DRAFT_1814930 [Coprinellus micaceus]|uniref:DUF6533 domain-containing protein n=1 Tax=Coprinellus micaceus TaxID=71717 RepID=A0A4Y7T792_COPMI|nr:hypothetical protein FA13DRAFT_1814930 [Coprinellus micaceus]
MSSAPSIEELIADRKSAFSTHCIGLAALTLYFCDYIQSFEAEVGLIWGKSWTLGKVLFFMLRYLTAFDVIFGNYLDDLYWIAPEKYGPIAFPSSVVANVFALVVPYSQLGVFFLCIYCLLGAKKKWKITFIVLFTLMGIFSATLMINHLVRVAIKASDTSLFRVIGNYWVFARNLIVFMIGSAAIYKRYRDSVKGADANGESIANCYRASGWPILLSWGPRNESLGVYLLHTWVPGRNQSSGLLWEHWPRAQYDFRMPYAHQPQEDHQRARDASWELFCYAV